MATSPFDLGALFRVIDEQRQRHGLSWAALARQVEVSASTIRRYREAVDAEADGVLALVRWLDVIPEDFVAASNVEGTKLASAGGGFVRVDIDLVAEANGNARGARGATRTSIQRLVEAAQASGQTVAALTRITNW